MSHERSIDGGDWSVNHVCCVARVFVPWGPLVGFTEHLDSGDTTQIILYKDLSCATDGRGKEGFFCISKTKKKKIMLANVQLHQLKEGVYEILAAIFVLGFWLTHSMAHCNGEQGFLTQTKPNIAPCQLPTCMVTHKNTHSLYTHIHSHKHWGRASRRWESA